jgi:hypothetical protein
LTSGAAVNLTYPLVPKQSGGSLIWRPRSRGSLRTIVELCEAAARIVLGYSSIKKCSEAFGHKIIWDTWSTKKLVPGMMPADLARPVPEVIRVAA